MRRLLVNICAAVIALPYRLRFASVGRAPRIKPPLMLRGAGRIQIGHQVLLEQFAGLSVVSGGEITIGDACELRSFCRVEAHGGFVRLGARSSVNPFVLLAGHGGLTIGSDVRIASHCVILTSTHRYESADTPIREQGITSQPTTIGDDVWFGSGCTVLGGVTIGRGSIVGAGSIVTRDIPPNSIAMGAPARVVRSRGAASPPTGGD